MKIRFAFILLTKGIFGGAERRFTQLLEYLISKFPDQYYLIVTKQLYDKILKMYPKFPVKYLLIVGENSSTNRRNNYTARSYTSFQDEHLPLVKQVYRFLKNYKIQKGYFREIERIKKEKHIKCFLGIYSGILPLYFYLQKKKRDVSVIFCNMDSWFDDVLPEQKKFWYRKYSSFNYALKKSDYIDFLSPFILEGIRNRGIKVKDGSVSITPCSFTDYSKCRIGDKTIFQVAFAGRLEKDKNPELFIEAAIILSKKYPEIIFHIMGEGAFFYNVKERVLESKASNILFHGFHPQPTEILADTSVFVSIQTTNNYPSQSVLEAMACGNAIIATDVGDTRMFVNENNGILIKLDVLELAGAIEKLYKNKELCQKLGDFAYKYVRENHNIQKVANYYINLFQQSSSKFRN